MADRSSEILARYELESELGHGGAGEVHLARDRKLGRLVALKFIRPEAKSQKADARFLREVHLQGQLEHPSIVPVYDLVTNDGGETCFAMRHVHGETLEEVLAKLRDGDEESLRRYSSHKLLSCFVSICLAVDFAHQRGVIHRDLKPANIMLGDFGEAYLLDWGVAKAKDAAEPETAAAGGEGDRPLLETRSGAMLGTPGYMAPEQLRGDLEAIGPASDVYSLGAILFEIVTLEPLHPRTTMFEIAESTLAGADAEISARIPDLAVAPELEAICVKATQLEPAERFASARELARALESFLDGTRDAELRGKLAVEQAALGAVSAASADSDKSHGARSAALRHFTRALSLDPENDAARTGLAKLLTDVPSELPDEARAEIESLRRDYERTGAQRGALVLIAGLASSALLFALEVKSVAVAAAYVALVIVMGVLAWIGPRGSPRFRAVRRYVNLSVGIALLLVGGRVFGPLVMVPAIACAMVVPFVANERPSRRPWVVAAAASAIAIPAVLEALGWIAPAYQIRDGAMLVLPRAFDFTSPWTLPYLLAISVLMVVAAGYLVSGHVSRASEATDRLELQAWYLRQVVPELADAMRGQRARRAGVPDRARGANKGASQGPSS